VIVSRHEVLACSPALSLCVSSALQSPFDNPDYIFELKHDGFRAIAYIEDGKCKLVSHNQNHFNFLFLSVALGKLPVDNAIVDGEVVSVDANGVSQFNH
jgi:bifunctional non-homologous end joining protein LigD